MDYVRYCNDCYMESPPTADFCLHCRGYMTVVTPRTLAAPGRRKGFHLDPENLASPLGRHRNRVLLMVTFAL